MCRSVRSIGIRALIGIVAFAGAVSARESPSRKEAVAAMGANIETVRKAMNSDPKEVQRTLIWHMADPAGDDPRVLALCSELIEKSTSSATVWYAARAIGGVVDAHIRHKTLDNERKRQIAAILRKTAGYDDHRVRMTAARDLERLGGLYQREALELYVSILSSPRDAADQTRRRRNRIDAIREILRLDGEKAAASIQKATDDDDLIKFFESEIPAGSSPVVQEENRSFLEHWKRVMVGGGKNK